MPPIPLDPFRLCVFARHRPIEIAYTCLSLFFGASAYASTSTHHRELHVFSDFSAFSTIIRFGFKAGLAANAVAVSRPSIVHTIVQDATVYFFVIFTSHLILLSTLVFERVGITCIRFTYVILTFSRSRPFNSFPQSGMTFSFQS